jgi:hypothetical protein
MMRKLRFLIAAAGLVVAAGSRADAQEASRPHGQPRVPVLVALVDDTVSSPGYRIVRRHGTGPEDLIVLGRDADTLTFSRAVWNLMLIRRTTGDTASAAGEVRLRSGSPSAAPRSLPWTTRVLTDLHRAEPAQLTGIGLARTLRLWLPAQRQRAAAPLAPATRRDTLSSRMTPLGRR